MTFYYGNTMKIRKNGLSVSGITGWNDKIVALEKMT